METTLRALTSVEGHARSNASFTWFCGHCASPSPTEQAPAPDARVCPSCGLGLLLETRSDVAPGPQDCFLVIDDALQVQAVSRKAEKLLRVREDLVVNRPLSSLLVAAESDGGASEELMAAILEVTDGEDDPRRVHVRPHNTFGVRIRARVAPCGPPRAALIVLEGTRAHRLRRS